MLMYNIALGNTFETIFCRCQCVLAPACLSFRTKGVWASGPLERAGATWWAVTTALWAGALKTDVDLPFHTTEAGVWKKLL